MWDTVRQWLHTLPVREEVVESVLMVMALLVLRGVLLNLYLRRHPHYSIEEKRRSLVLSRNLTLILTIFGLAVIWATQIQTLALSMFAVAAAIVVATKELIMCLSGSILRSVTKQYSVGDYIEVNGLRGRVVDINLLNTLMMQIGPNPLVGQLSGKTLSFPNSLLLNHSVRRDNIFGRLCDSYSGNSRADSFGFGCDCRSSESRIGAFVPTLCARHPAAFGKRAGGEAVHYPCRPAARNPRAA